MDKKRLFVWTFLFFSLFFFSCNSPESPEVEQVLKRAVLTIITDRVPVLVEWNPYTNLWQVTPTVIVSETNGVGVTIAEAKIEFIYQSVTYEPQIIGGGRIEANHLYQFYVDISTEYFYEKIRFTITGKDDNGYNIKKEKEFDLHYVD